MSKLKVLRVSSIDSALQTTMDLMQRLDKVPEIRSGAFATLRCSRVTAPMLLAARETAAFAPLHVESNN
jgi:hypothetical protein